LVKKIIAISSVSTIIIISLFSYAVYLGFFDINTLPKDKFIKEVTSPDREYSIKAYVSETSLSAPAVRGELNYLKENKKPKNIYWNYREDDANIEWIDSVTIIINGHKLNVLYDKFDWRNVD
jgi:hypothetical protein